MDGWEVTQRHDRIAHAWLETREGRAVLVADGPDGSDSPSNMRPCAGRSLPNTMKEPLGFWVLITQSRRDNSMAERQDRGRAISVTHVTHRKKKRNLGKTRNIVKAGALATTSKRKCTTTRPAHRMHASSVSLHCFRARRPKHPTAVLFSPGVPRGGLYNLTIWNCTPQHSSHIAKFYLASKRGSPHFIPTSFRYSTHM